MESDKKPNCRVNILKYGRLYEKGKRLFVFLPCSSKKPYKESVTHKYIHLVLKRGLNPERYNQIQICTISEVLGIIPENIEDEVFSDETNNYNSLPMVNDIDDMVLSLFDYITSVPYEISPVFCVYATAMIFRAVAKKTDKLLIDYGLSLTLLPEEVDTTKALFEFRKRERVRELIDFCFRNL